jgi:hypothetical protein
MDRSGLELGLRNAGAGAERLSALPCELTEAAAGGSDGSDDAREARFRRRRSVSWPLDRSELDIDWQLPLAVSDADIEDDFGDFCGRRVA